MILSKQINDRKYNELSREYNRSLREGRYDAAVRYIEKMADIFKEEGRLESMNELYKIRDEIKKHVRKGEKK